MMGILTVFTAFSLRGENKGFSFVGSLKIVLLYSEKNRLKMIHHMTFFEFLFLFLPFLALNDLWIPTNCIRHEISDRMVGHSLSNKDRFKSYSCFTIFS